MFFDGKSGYFGDRTMEMYHIIRCLKKYPLLLNLVEKSASRQLQSQPVLKNAKIAIFGILGQFWGFHNFFVGTLPKNASLHNITRGMEKHLKD